MGNEDKQMKEVLDLAKDALKYEQDKKMYGKEAADNLYAMRHSAEGILGVVWMAHVLATAVGNIILNPPKYWYVWLVAGGIVCNLALSSVPKHDGRPSPAAFVLCILWLVPGCVCLLLFLYDEVVRKWDTISLQPGKCPFRVGVALIWGLPMLGLVIFALILAFTQLLGNAVGGR